jgi:protein tyrosine phosphatase
MNSTDISEIIPHLYLSNWFTSDNPNILKKYNIKAIISLETMPKSVSVLNYYKNNNIDHMYIYIPDIPSADISEYFNETYKFIKKHISKGENVLVHCMAGISRSSTIVLNYLLRNLYENNPEISFNKHTYNNTEQNSCPCNILKNVLNYVRQQRRVVNPNNGFMKKLLLATIEYEKIAKMKYKNQLETFTRNIY